MSIIEVSMKMINSIDSIVIDTIPDDDGKAIDDTIVIYLHSIGS